MSHYHVVVHVPWKRPVSDAGNGDPSLHVHNGDSEERNGGSKEEEREDALWSAEADAQLWKMYSSQTECNCECPMNPSSFKLSTQ